MRRLFVFALVIGAAGLLPISARVSAQVVKIAPVRVQIVAEAKGGVAIDPQKQQFLQQFRPILREELRLVRTACEPTKEQRKAIIKEGEKALDDAATKFAEVQKQMMGGGWRKAPVYPDARKLIQGGMAAAVQARLFTEQSARYAEEVERRAADRKEAGIRNVLVELDRGLGLSDDQRDKIGAALSSQWDDPWFVTVQWAAVYQNEQFFPDLPDKVIVPFLTRQQTDIWRGLQKINLGGNSGFVGLDVNDGIDTLDGAGAAGPKMIDD